MAFCENRRSHSHNDTDLQRRAAYGTMSPGMAFRRISEVKAYWSGRARETRGYAAIYVGSGAPMLADQDADQAGEALIEVFAP